MFYYSRLACKKTLINYVIDEMFVREKDKQFDASNINND